MRFQNVAVVEEPKPSVHSLSALEGATELTREELAQHESAIATMALEESTRFDEPAVLLRFRGRAIHARPIDLRRFVRAMAPHVSMN